MYNELKNQIITGLLSSPVIYISHFHYQLVDEMLMEIVAPTTDRRKILNLDENAIIEYDLSEGIINFRSKTREKDLDAYSNIYTYLSDIVEYNLILTGRRYSFLGISHMLSKTLRFNPFLNYLS